MYVFLSATPTSSLKSSDLRLSSHVLKDFALNRAVSVGLSVEVLSAITNSVTSVTSYGHLDALWAVHCCATIAAIGNHICASKCKAGSIGANGSVETVRNSLDFSGRCTISIQLINARS